MASRTKIATTKVSLSNAISEGYSVAEGLKDELSDWLGNLPESLQNGDLADRLQTAIDGLENPQEPDSSFLPADIQDREIEVSYLTKRKMSRSLRLGEGISHLQQAVEILNGLKEEFTDETDPDNSADWVDDVDNLVNDLEEAISEFEGVEFPGMFGR